MSDPLDLVAKQISGEEGMKFSVELKKIADRFWAGNRLYFELSEHLQLDLRRLSSQFSENKSETNSMGREKARKSEDCSRDGVHRLF